MLFLLKSDNSTKRVSTVSPSNNFNNISIASEAKLSGANPQVVISGLVMLAKVESLEATTEISWGM